MARLKIKDEIDLKELEKFGYEYSYGGYEKRIDWQAVYIDEDTRTLTWGGDFDADYIEYDYYAELVDDLIKAGLVEEVKEK